MTNPEPMPFQGKFEWTDSLIKEFMLERFDKRYKWGGATFEVQLENFKQSQMQKVYPSGILEFYDGKEFYWRESDRTCDYQTWVKCQLTDKNHKIWSVQNGDEVLVVGDDVDVHPYLKHSINGKIASFKIHPSSSIILVTESQNKYRLPDINIIKRKEKAFTSSEVKEKISTAFRGFYSDDLYMKILKEFE